MNMLLRTPARKYPADRRRAVLTLAAALALFSAPPLLRADPILTNGDFSLGNTGFSTGYTYNSTNVQTESTYAITTDPHNVHPSFASAGDHTTGTGNMMVVNGSPNANTIVWSETVNLAANTNYIFNAWEANAYPANPAQLSVSLNGVVLGSLFSVTGADTWNLLQRSFNSGAGGKSTFAIVDVNLATAGNDFLLDDLSVTVAPEPSSLLLLGTGIFTLLGVLRLRHNESSAQEGIAA